MCEWGVCVCGWVGGGVCVGGCGVREKKQRKKDKPKN